MVYCLKTGDWKLTEVWILYSILVDSNGLLCPKDLWSAIPWVCWNQLSIHFDFPTIR